MTNYCQVSIRGSYDVPWTEYLGDLPLKAEVHRGEVCTTILSGRPADLASFISMLSMLRDTGFTVIACEYHCTDAEN